MITDLQSLRRFYAKVSLSAQGCLEWRACISTTGYGRFNIGGRNMGAHRVAFSWHKGVIPEDMCVLHRCDNRVCVNVDHLFLGTVADNNADMMSKGRHVPVGGTKNGNAILAWEDVELIRNSPLPSRHLAVRIGISDARIRQIRRMEGWIP